MCGIVAEKTILTKKKTNKRRGLTDKEKQAVFDNFDKFSRFEQGLLMLLYYTGMRRNEILALQKKDIDLEKKIVPITPHYFRHNFTTDLIYAGVPLKTVQTIMGHENIQTTMDIYTDVRYDNNKLIEKLDNYLK